MALDRKGGFPPIRLCDKDNNTKEIKKEKEFISHASTISIKDILKKRSEKK